MEINQDSNKKLKKTPSFSEIMSLLLKLVSISLLCIKGIEIDLYFINGALLFATGLYLHFKVIDLDKSNLFFKISNLLAFYFMLIGFLIEAINLMEYMNIINEVGMVLYIKLIEIPALILSLYFYFKHKNNYILLTSFLIFNFMIFVSLSLLLEDMNDQYNIAENSPLVLAYLNIIILLCLKYSNKLISTAKKTYNALILIYNLIGAFFYLDIYHEEMHLYFVGWMVISNLILIPINIKYDKKYFNKMLIPISIIWLLMPIIMVIFN